MSCTAKIWFIHGLEAPCELSHRSAGLVMLRDSQCKGALELATHVVCSQSSGSLLSTNYIRDQIFRGTKIGP